MYRQTLSILPRNNNPPSLLLRRLFSSNAAFESADDFERRLFGGGGASNEQQPNNNSSSFFNKLERFGRGNHVGGGRENHGEGFPFGYDSLMDGMDDKLKKAAEEEDIAAEANESLEEDYMYRPDVVFHPNSNYTPEDLDVTKPGIQKSFANTNEFQTTTKEVLKQADFRNVGFLSNFLTEAGIIIKRSHTKISAKAQRKVAREIKTARAFGLMPFTCMGTKKFTFGKSMEDNEDNYNYDYSSYDNRNTAQVSQGQYNSRNMSQAPPEPTRLNRMS